MTDLARGQNAITSQRALKFFSLFPAGVLLVRVA